MVDQWNIHNFWLTNEIVYTFCNIGRVYVLLLYIYTLDKIALKILFTWQTPKESGHVEEFHYHSLGTNLKKN